MLLPVLLLAHVPAAGAPPRSPPCLGTGGTMAGREAGPAVRRVAALPAGVRAILPARLADADGPFDAGDLVGPGREGWPFVRLTCGYAIPDGYVGKTGS